MIPFGAMTIMMIPSEWRDEIKLSWLTNCDPPEYKPDLTEEEEEAIDKRYHDWEDANIEIYQYSANGDIPLWLARRLLANRKCTYDEARRAYDPIKADLYEHRRRFRCTPRSEYILEWFAQEFGVTDPELVKEYRARGIDAPDRRKFNGNPNFYEIAERAKEEKYWKTGSYW